MRANRSVSFHAGAAFALLIAAWRTATPAAAQQPAAPPRAPGSLYGVVPSAAAVYELEDAFLRWPLPPGAEAYAAIDGRRIHGDVLEQVAIARRYRDQGHQFWGRIIGTSADDESARWLMAKLQKAGLSDVRMQPHDLAPQWMARSWQVSVKAGGTTRVLESSQPTYETTATTGQGLDLEAVFVGTGSEAEFIGRDVRGKAAFIFSMPLPGGTRPQANAEGATLRAAEKGAAAIFLIIAQPGNMKTQLYPVRTNVPTFAVGMQDGYLVRDLIGQTPAQAPRVQIRLDAERVANLKTSTVWATLPGATDETIYITAHRDGWFDAAGDNAGGVAAMIGLAEHYAKIPRAQRRRTIVFLGLSGHHNSANKSIEWLTEHRDEVFAKTALLINSEHPSTIQTYLYWEDIRWANTYTAQFWYAGGPSRPNLQDIAIRAFRDFGVSTYAQPERMGPPGDMSVLWRYVPAVTTSDFNTYFHMDAETAETVPWTGLEASTRAYAKIIDEVNKLALSELQRPPEMAP